VRPLAAGFHISKRAGSSVREGGEPSLQDRGSRPSRRSVPGRYRGRIQMSQKRLSSPSSSMRSPGSPLWRRGGARHDRNSYRSQLFCDACITPVFTSKRGRNDPRGGNNARVLGCYRGELPTSRKGSAVTRQTTGRRPAIVTRAASSATRQFAVPPNSAEDRCRRRSWRQRHQNSEKALRPRGYCALNTAMQPCEQLTPFIL